MSDRKTKTKAGRFLILGQGSPAKSKGWSPYLVWNLAWPSRECGTEGSTVDFKPQKLTSVCLGVLYL